MLQSYRNHSVDLYYHGLKFPFLPFILIKPEINKRKTSQCLIEKCLLEKHSLSCHLRHVYHVTCICFSLFTVTVIHSILKRTRSSQKLGNKMEEDRRFKAEKREKLSLLLKNV